MLSNLKNSFNRYINQQQQFITHLPLLGLGRTVLAGSLLLTLLLTDPYTLFVSAPPKDEAIRSMLLFNNINFFKFFDAGSINMARWLAIIALLWIISGYTPQITCFLHWYLAHSFLGAAVDIEGGDQVCANMALLLIPLCVLDRRLNHWRPAKAATRNWQRLTDLFCANWFWLIRLQVMVIYLHAAVGKMVETEWFNGTALYYWFNHPVFGMQGWMKPLVNPIVLNQHFGFILTWAVMLLELLLGVSLLIHPRHYKRLFWAGMIFHFFIILFHGLFSFFIAMAGALILGFLIPWKNEKMGWLKVAVK